MAVTGVGLCLSVVFICVIVNTLVKARTLKLRHDHHSRTDYRDYEESMPPRDLSSRRLEEREDDSEYRDSYKREEERRVYLEALDGVASSEYEDAEERIPASHARYRHGLRSRGSSRRENEESWYGDRESGRFSPRYAARRKRQNKHDSVAYRAMTDEDRRRFLTSKRREYEKQLRSSADLREPFEIEVKEAQNSTVCNYTVESIPDTRGSRIPRDLEHVKCNHSGSSCQGATDTYCCIQTYKRIEVSYGDGTKENMKIYVGCVCALRNLLHGLMESTLPTND